MPVYALLAHLARQVRIQSRRKQKSTTQTAQQVLLLLPWRLLQQLIVSLQNYSAEKQGVHLAYSSALLNET